MKETAQERVRLAVLIDADNTSAQIADGLFDEIATLGEATVRRLYGDFTSSRMKGWSKVISRHAITEHQQRAHTSGKNASDIALVIDAMDLLHSGRFEGFCLISSDSDFTRLASRLREEGVDVFGFGQEKTPESFRQACKRFIYTENLMPDSAGKRAAQPIRKTRRGVAKLLTKAIEQLDQEGGWVSLSRVGNQVAQLAPDFDQRNYGFAKLSDLARNEEAFEIEKLADGSVRIRLQR